MNHEIEYKDLIISRPFLFLGKCIVWAGMIIAGVVLVGMPVWWAQGAGMLLVAMAIAHGIELEHQALHATGIGKRWLDMTLGFVLGLPLLISPHHYQDRHLYHHQHVGTSKDSEFFQFSKVDNNRMLRFAINLLMLPHWAMVAKLLRASWTGGSMGHVYNKLNERRIRRDYRLFGVITIAAAALIAVFRPFDPVPLLAFPLAACIHTLVELPEHWGCAKNSSVFENTRTVRAGWLVTWFTNGNNYHVEHHYAPALRPETLHAFHARIADRIVHSNSSYFDLIQEIINRRAGCA